MPAAKPSQVIIRRATKAALALGGQVEIRPDGTIRILAAAASAPLPSVEADEGNTCDALFGDPRP